MDRDRRQDCSREQERRTEHKDDEPLEPVCPAGHEPEIDDRRLVGRPGWQWPSLYRLGHAQAQSLTPKGVVIVTYDAARASRG
jgi:hypothetical protein